MPTGPIPKQLPYASSAKVLHLIPLQPLSLLLALIHKITLSNEQLHFDLSLKQGEEVDIRLKALTILGHMDSTDLSRKVCAYNSVDNPSFPVLQKHYDKPHTTEEMKKHIANPQILRKKYAFTCVLVSGLVG